jgi:hypothetical protein
MAEEKQQIAILGTSSIQLKEQSSLSRFVQSNEELDIVKCVEGSMQIARIAEVDLTKNLMGLVGQWRVMIGLPKKEISEELAIVYNFVKDNYGHLTIGEIKLAMNLSIMGKLFDCEFHGIFSPMYVASVLNSYMFYRKRLLTDAIRRKEKHDAEILEQQNKPSPEQQAKTMKELVLDLYNEYKEKAEVRDHFSYIYKFLRRIEQLPLTQEDVALAQAYGKRKWKEEKPLEFKTMGSNSSDKFNEDRLARNWCVQNLFDKVDINVLLNNIKSEQFT